MITLKNILEAQKRIEKLIIRTPLKPSYTLSKKTGRNIWLKLENMQPTGAFKIRGAANAVLNLSEEQQRRGVITISTGNHGKALAYVAGKLGVNAVICVSELVPEVKLKGMKDLGVELVIHGKDQDEADKKARELSEERGLFFISAYDNRDVIAGQGTIALEIFEQNPLIDTLIIPLSAGGLMSGIAIAAKSADPEMKLIGVTMEEGAVMHLSLKAGKIVDVEEKKSLADALAGGLPKDNKYTFQICQKFVDDSLLVSEEAIAKAMVYALKYERLVLEGGAATPIALLNESLDKIPGKNICLICTGDNVDVQTLLNLYKEYQMLV